MSRGNRRAIELFLTLLGPLLILLIWEALSRTETIDSRFWPAPSSLWPTFTDLSTNHDLAGDVLISLRRVLLGFTVGAIPAIALGLVMGLWWPVRVFMMPLATAIYAVPKIAIYPLVIIALGLGEQSKVAIVAISIFFLVVLSTMAGVMAIDPIYQDVASNFAASRWQQFRTVAFPGALPAIFTGLKLALGFSMIVIVGAEFLSPERGLGSLIWESYSILAIDKMFVGLILTGLLGWVLIMLLELVERIAIPWNRPE